MLKPAVRILSLSFALLSIGSCTRGSAPARPELKAGTQPLRFSHEEVRQLSIVKSDPVSGDSWAAEVQHKGPEPHDWEIASAPFQILDRRANGTWIRHLLDTLRTISIDSPAGDGPPGSFGLERPRFGLRWSPPGMELRVGNENTDRTTFAAFPSGSQDGNRAYRAKGAAFEMLKFLEGFESLRLRTLATFEADDIDEIEVRRRDGRKAYAQREGDEWTDRNHRRLRGDIRQRLEGITHARILEFIDDETRARELRGAIAKGWTQEIELRDRQGAATVIRLTTRNGELYGEINSRRNSVFKLYPQLKETVLSFF